MVMGHGSSPALGHCGNSVQDNSDIRVMTQTRIGAVGHLGTVALMHVAYIVRSASCVFKFSCGAFAFMGQPGS